MKPTLYAEDVEQMASNKLYHLRRTLQWFARVLPRRCPGANKLECADGLLWEPGASFYNEVCPTCPDGAGFLYPPTPDWWAERRFTEWETFCDLRWRALGIMDTE